MKKYRALKCIGVWMDHAEARLIDPSKPPSTIETIHSPLKTHVRVAGESPDGTRLGGYRSTNNEFGKHNLHQNEIHSFYKDLAARLQPFDEILIFGPTPARHEFLNFILKDKSFAGKKILNRQGNYLTDNQLVEFVKENLQGQLN